MTYSDHERSHQGTHDVFTAIPKSDTEPKLNGFREGSFRGRWRNVQIVNFKGSL